MMLDTFHQILKEKQVTPVFQPLVDLRSGFILGYEGLIRGPEQTSFYSPLALFDAARQCGRVWDLEELCCHELIASFRRQGLAGKLFLNSSPDMMMRMLGLARRDCRAGLPQLAGMDWSRLVVELTESERTDSYYHLHQATEMYRQEGLQFAIDDLGEGYASLRLWSELRPEYVKIDKYFVRDIDTDMLKQQLVRSICDIANHAQSTVIAEGIETEAELRTLRYLGVACGQGYLLSRPQPAPPARLEPGLAVLFGPAAGHSRPLSQERHAMSVRRLLRSAPAVADNTPTNRVYDLFQSHPDLSAIALLCDGRPTGILRRSQLYDQLARPYHRELYGNKPCSMFIETSPLIVDSDTSLLELGALMSQGADDTLSDGFIITSEGEYMGLGSSVELMREITQIQITTARYANPLTQLPGNVPINEHIDALLRNRTSFAVCYADLDHFKPYNDLYGYRKGDDLLRAMAELFTRHAVRDADFVGHVGGDDFILVFTSPDWARRCQMILDELACELEPLYLSEHLQAGGYLAENRQGVPVFHPLVSLSLGVVLVDRPEQYSGSLIAELATSAKAQAKKIQGNALFVERRHPETPVRQAQFSREIVLQ
ncbi:MAG TPA: GGDEF domain-containing protein [Alcaligenes sp.]|nr:GGDEF domain-containing protein [Alcaligenes sp.]HRL26165.1 GGDEF domain-containing protein [Alcaligenes sp.]